MAQFYATNLNHMGTFWFNTLKEYLRDKVSQDEYEIGFVSGTKLEETIVRCFTETHGIYESNLELMFDILEEAKDESEESRVVSFIYQCECLREEPAIAWDNTDSFYFIWCAGTADFMGTEQEFVKSYLYQDDSTFEQITGVSSGSVAGQYFDADSWARDSLVNDYNVLNCAFGYFLFPTQ